MTHKGDREGHTKGHTKGLLTSARKHDTLVALDTVTMGIHVCFTGRTGYTIG